MTASAAEPIAPGTYQTVRCRAHSSRTGQPCQRPAIRGGAVCQTHGGRAPQVKRAAADRMRALEAPALDVYEELMGPDAPPAIRFAVAKDVLERNGVGREKLPSGTMTFTLRIDRGDGDSDA